MKKLICNLTKKKIIILLLVLVFVLGALSLLSGKKTPPTKPKASAKPSPSQSQEHFKIEEKTPTEAEIIQKEIKTTKELYPLIEWLPLETENYHLTYLKAGVLQVTIKQGSKEEITKQVVAWIRSKGIEPASHEIIFR